MGVIAQILGLLFFLYYLLLIARFVLDLSSSFAPQWRPKGPVLVLALFVFSVTDPPIKLFNRIIPPLRVGDLQLQFGLLLTFIALSLVQTIVLGFLR